MDGPRWRVVGGADRGGILAREGPELTSGLLPGKLATGAIVGELQRTGDRLRYRLVRGGGPAVGWVSLRLGRRVLLEELPGDPLAAPTTARPVGQADQERDLAVQILTLGTGAVPELRVPQAATIADVLDRVEATLNAPGTDKKLVAGTRVLDGAEVLGELGEAGSGPLQLTLVQTRGIALGALSGGDDGSLLLWDLKRGALVRKLQLPSAEGSAIAVTCVALDLHSQSALTGSDSGALQLWDIGRGSILRELAGHSKSVTDLSVDWPTLRALSAGADCVLLLWDLAYGEVLRSLAGHRGTVRCVAWDARLELAISGSMDCALRVWDTLSGDVANELKAHMAPVMCVAADFQRHTALSGSIAIVRVWTDILSPHALYRDIEGHAGLVVALSVDFSRQLILTADQDGVLRIFGARRGGVETLRGPGAGLNCATPLWGSHRFLCGAADGCLRLCDKSGTVEQELNGHRGAVLCVALGGADPPADGTATSGETLAPLETAAPLAAEVLLSFPDTCIQGVVYPLLFRTGKPGPSGSARPPVAELRGQLAENYRVPYLERLRFRRPGGALLRDFDRVPLPPMVMLVEGPGSVVQALQLALEGRRRPASAPPTRPRGRQDRTHDA